MIERSVFYKGSVYVVEEEMYSDSDNSSIYTSEDSFDEDNDVGMIFKEKSPLKTKKVEVVEVKKKGPASWFMAAQMK